MNDEIVLAVPAIAIVLILGYSFMREQLLLLLSVVSPLLFFYLLWRLARAAERIADALETRER